MKLAAFLIPPGLDAKQALRLRRFGLAALTYVLGTVLLGIAWAFHALPAASALYVAATYVLINIALYAAFRSGFNLRFADPSLTRLQILTAVTLLMFTLYHMDYGRNIMLFVCFIIFLFGVFRLDIRGFMRVTLYTLAAYALVIDLLMYLRPSAVKDVRQEWLSWLMFAALLPGFSIIGAQINTLRRRLRDSEARFRSLTEMSSDFYWESDAGHRLTLLGSGGKASGVPALNQAPQTGKRRWEIPYLAPDEAGWRAHREILDAHQSFRNFELSRMGADGAARHISISGDPVFDESGTFTGYRGIGTDITGHKLTEQRIQRVAHHDSLTGLPNRLLFNDRLQQAISRAKRDARQFALLYLDLDKFKPVNDSLGHAAGDELLRAVAERIRRQVRESDTVARVGGDEFTVILPDISKDAETERVANKIITALSTPFLLGLDAKAVGIGSSIGIAIYPGDGRDADTLVSSADAAMYRAKQTGNSYRFSRE